jgi:DNA-binding NtrC family response regulator
MPRPTQVLVASSDPVNGHSLEVLLADCGLEAVVASSLEEVCTHLAGETISLVVCDAQLTDGSFREILQFAESSRIPVVVASRLPDTRQYLEAMRLGAFDFIASPYRRTELQQIVFNALQQSVALDRATSGSRPHGGISAAT